MPNPYDAPKEDTANVYTRDPETGELVLESSNRNLGEAVPVAVPPVPPKTDQQLDRIARPGWDRTEALPENMGREALIKLISEYETPTKPYVSPLKSRETIARHSAPPSGGLTDMTEPGEFGDAALEEEVGKKIAASPGRTSYQSMHDARMSAAERALSRMKKD